MDSPELVLSLVKAKDRDRLKLRTSNNLDVAKKSSIGELSSTVL